MLTLCLNKIAYNSHVTNNNLESWDWEDILTDRHCDHWNHSDLVFYFVVWLRIQPLSWQGSARPNGCLLQICLNMACAPIVKPGRYIQDTRKTNLAFTICVEMHEQHMNSTCEAFVNIATFGPSPANSGRRFEQQQSMSFQIVAWLEAFYGSFHT